MRDFPACRLKRGLSGRPWKHSISFDGYHLADIAGNRAALAELFDICRDFYGGGVMVLCAYREEET